MKAESHHVVFGTLEGAAEFGPRCTPLLVAAFIIERTELTRIQGAFCFALVLFI